MALMGALNVIRGFANRFGSTPSDAKPATPPQESNAVQPLDVSPPAYHVPSAPAPPDVDLWNNISSWHSYGPDSSLHEAEHYLGSAIDLWKGLSPSYKESPIPLRPNLLAQAKLSIDQGAGKINLADLQKSVQDILDNPPVPKTMDVAERTRYMDEIFRPVPERPGYDLSTLAGQALFSLGAGGGGANTRGILGGLIENQKNLNEANYQTDVKNAGIASQRASAELNARMSDIDHANQFALDAYNAKLRAANYNVEAAKTRQAQEDADTRFNQTRYDAANTIGEKIRTAQALGMPAKFGADGNLQQEGTDPVLWQDVQEIKAKQTKDDRLQMEHEIARYRQGQLDRMNLTGSNYNAEQDEADRKALLDKWRPQFGDVYIPPPLTGTSLRKERMDQLQQNYEQNFASISATRRMNAIAKVLDAQEAEDRLQIALQTGRGNAGKLSHQVVQFTRQGQLDKAQFASESLEAKYKSYNEEIKPLQTQAEALRNSIPTIADYSQKTAARNELKTLQTRIQDIEKASITAKANWDAAKATYKKMVDTWGADGSLNLPPEIQPSQIGQLSDHTQTIAALKQAAGQVMHGTPPIGAARAEGLQMIQKRPDLADQIRQRFYQTYGVVLGG